MVNHKMKCTICGWFFGDNFSEHTATKASCKAFYRPIKKLPLLPIRHHSDKQKAYTVDEMTKLFPD